MQNLQKYVFWNIWCVIKLTSDKHKMWGIIIIINFLHNNISNERSKRITRAKQ